MKVLSYSSGGEVGTSVGGMIRGQIKQGAASCSEEFDFAVRGRGTAVESGAGERWGPLCVLSGHSYL